MPLGLAAVWGMLSKSQQPPLNVDAGDSRMHVSTPWSVAFDVGGNNPEEVTTSGGLRAANNDELKIINNGY